MTFAHVGSTFTTCRILVAVWVIREQLAEALSGIEPRSSRTAFFSTSSPTPVALWTPVSWAPTTGSATYARLWNSTKAVRTASQSGYRTFIESSPHPALINELDTLLGPDHQRWNRCDRCPHAGA